MIELVHNCLKKKEQIYNNGCSPKWLTDNLPWYLKKIQSQILFSPSCAIHDFRYYVGNTEEERKFADKEFYENMKKQVKKKKWYKRPFLNLGAFLFYKLVEKYGNTAFNYGEKKTYYNLQFKMYKMGYSKKELNELKTEYLKKLNAGEKNEY